MKSVCWKDHSIVLFAAILIGLSLSSTAFGEAKVNYLYDLTDFFGPVTSFWGHLLADEQSGEIYVLDSKERVVRIFNEYGMEIYRFDGDGEIGYMKDIAIDEKGNIFIIAFRGRGPVIVRCNYRGEPVSDIEIQGLPPAFSGFSPDRIVIMRNHLYLADTRSLRIAVTDTNGLFEKGYDVAPLIEIDEEKRAENSIVGFSVDREGNLIFTIPVLFRAYILSPDGKITGFGTSGSTPGKFGIAAGIGADSDGNLYVADTLRCVVIVFDHNFTFQTEFGFRGYHPGNLIAPRFLTIDGMGRVYVSQGGRGWVSVFRVTMDAQDPERDNLIHKPLEEEVIRENEAVTTEIITGKRALETITTSSVKGKPAVRRGHKADGSQGDGRAAGEKTTRRMQ